MEVLILACLALLFEIRAEWYKDDGERLPYIYCRVVAFLAWVTIILVTVFSVLEGLNK